MISDRRSRSLAARGAEDGHDIDLRERVREEGEEGWKGEEGGEGAGRGAREERTRARESGERRARTFDDMRH